MCINQKLVKNIKTGFRQVTTVFEKFFEGTLVISSIYVTNILNGMCGHKSKLCVDFVPVIPNRETREKLTMGWVMYLFIAP